jgi:N-acetylmuramoyl-L-alanine amidase
VHLTIFKINKIKLFALELFRLKCLSLFIFFSINLSICLAQEVIVKDMVFSDLSLNKSQLKIKLSKKTNFKIYTLRNPHRLVIDVENAKLVEEKFQPNLVFFTKNFNANSSDIFLRLEFSLQKKITIESSFYDEKNQTIIAKINVAHADLSSFIDKVVIADDKNNAPEINNNDQRKIDEKNQQNKSDNFVIKDSLNSPSKIKSNKDISNDIAINKTKNKDYKIVNDQSTSIKTTEFNNNEQQKKINKIPVIVIDAGHGGKDPGTIGNYLRSKEKNITLSFSRELYKQLKSTKNYKVYLTRNSDIFINLRRRVELARKKNADLFISLHVNAIGDDDITGFSIYTLSEQSSDKQAELLAHKENQADIINGVNFAGASVDIMKTLIDLSQRNSKNDSAIFANKVIKNVKESNIEILQNTHRFAGFAVLTAPDMASVLVELGYLSNNEEEKLLNSISYKRKVCESLVKAIEEYFSKIKT